MTCLEASKEQILFGVFNHEITEKNLFLFLLCALGVLCGGSVPMQIVPFGCVAICGLKTLFTGPSVCERVCITWILHESEAFICKAWKGAAIVDYCKSLLTQLMEASDSPEG
jgi:hypothetical protein